MGNTQKEQERSDLHNTIWRIANNLRGSVDGWDFKQYVLGFLFYRFISENLSSYLNNREKEAGDKGFDYALLSDTKANQNRKDIVAEKGFFIPPTELFVNVRHWAAKNRDLNETLEAIFKNIEASAKGTESEKAMKGLFDDMDVNSNKLGGTAKKRNEKLVKLLDAIGDLPIGNYGDNAIDIFGDAYEYLMTMYAANAGKSGGEFFTPQEVSELLARITVVGRKEVNKVYDPACGSGSLLLKFAKVLGKDNVRSGFFGQEINITNYNLCRINMFLHDIEYGEFDIAHGDTLTDPQHESNEPFEAIVSNPPYSIKWDGDENPLLINDGRFTPAGVLAPKSKADLAFVMHALSWLATGGTAAIVSFPGVMYRGGAEQKIRKYLVDENYVDAVIQLPTDLFSGTTIATCILVLKKNRSDTKVLFIDATNEFKRDSAKNKLGDDHITKILDCYTERKTRKYFSRLVPHKEIKEEEDYNISVGTYVAPKGDREVIDIKELNTRIKEIVSKQDKLRTQIDVIVADLEGKPLMRRIDDLIKRYCPDGVGLRKLGELLDYKQPTKYIVESTEYDDSYATPVITARNSLILGYTNETNGIYNASKKRPVIVFDDFTTSFHWVDFKFKVKSSAMKIITAKRGVTFKYVYYAMKNIRFAPSGYARHWILVYSNFEIPIPPLKVQKEIVDILDKFTQLEAELEAELEDERDARQKQYEYYRDLLLSFSKLEKEEV